MVWTDSVGLKYIMWFLFVIKYLLNSATSHYRPTEAEMKGRRFNSCVMRFLTSRGEISFLTETDEKTNSVNQVPADITGLWRASSKYISFRYICHALSGKSGTSSSKKQWSTWVSWPEGNGRNFLWFLWSFAAPVSHSMLVWLYYFFNYLSIYLFIIADARNNCVISGIRW